MKIWWPPFITVGARESLSMIKRGKEFCIASIKIPWWHPKCYENLNAWYIRHCQMKNRWPVEWMVLDWETLIFGNNNVKSLRRNNGGNRLMWSLCFQVFCCCSFYWSCCTSAPLSKLPLENKRNGQYRAKACSQ